MSKNNDEMVLVAVKTPMMARGTSARLAGSLSAAQALAELRRISPKNDATTSHVLNCLAREVAGPHDFLAVGKTGEVIKINPNQSLKELAIPREIRTSRGVESVKAVSLEIQQYCSVG